MYGFPALSKTVKGQCLMSDCTSASENLRPMRRFASKTVLWGFIATWFLAASPTRRSESVKATYDGVVRFPWSLAMISTRSFCQTPTQLEKSLLSTMSSACGRKIYSRVGSAKIDTDGLGHVAEMRENRKLRKEMGG